MTKPITVIGRRSLVGAVYGLPIVAAPRPDELEFLLMEFSRLRIAAFLPLSFALNFLGILAVGSAVRAFGA